MPCLPARSPGFGGKAVNGAVPELRVPWGISLIDRWRDRPAPGAMGNRIL